MQKLITVSVDTKQLVQTPPGAFDVNEVDSVNELLEQGWEIEEMQFVKGEAGDGGITVFIILNDDAMFDREDDFDDEFGFDEDEGEMDEIEGEQRR